MLDFINRNSARIVVGVWLLFVFILTSSYTANLSSMLTVKRLKSGRDIEWLKRNNLSVGCDNSSSFVKSYMMNVYNLHPQQIIDVDGENDIVAKFKSKTISALFLESPHEKVFLNKYCNDYTKITAAYRFGGLGFVCQKGSPMAKDFSEAILTLAENGSLKSLEDNLLTPFKECSNSSTSPEAESLTLNNFWGLYIICATISTICFVRVLFSNYLLNYRHYHPEEQTQLQGNVTTDADMKATRISTGFYNNVNNLTLPRAATLGSTRRRNSPRLENINTSDNMINPQRSLSAVKEML